MTGLKSGAGDDLWGDDTEETDEGDEEESTEGVSADRESDPSSSATADVDENVEQTPSSSGTSQSAEQPYIVRRALQDKSVQFECDERLTFFVHNDVVEGERELITGVESALGRNVPKFDLREAVYRAALRNREDVLDELLQMGYTLNQD